jgi:HNH endonuclease
MPSHSINYCKFPECKSKVSAYGFCSGHWWQHKNGREMTPIKDKRKRGSPPRIIYDESPCPVAELVGPCHIFRGRKDKDGYGTVFFRGNTYRVHRYTWEMKNGPIPERAVIDHRCRVKACCNADHLRAVTHQTNAIENNDSPPAINAAKTHCINGHLFDESSKRTFARGTVRVCRQCARERKRMRRERMRSQGLTPN